ncbi:MAG: Flp family type IVb pilin [Rhodospirillales bacterium]|nr:Flp family type IVb pilin [Rhodospirillales bacterium]MCB9994938.1 Flp family type IVb pilin [Rhodospirillales bacterium]
MIKRFIEWFQCDKGATAVEYGFIAGGIALAIVAAVFLSGESLQTIFNNMADTMSSTASKL